MERASIQLLVFFVLLLRLYLVFFLLLVVLLALHESHGLAWGDLCLHAERHRITIEFQSHTRI